MRNFPDKSDNFYALLGKLLVLFEEMVDAEKLLAVAVIQESGLRDPAMAESLVAHLNAEEIRRTLVTLLGIFYAKNKYMLAVSRHVTRRIDAANRSRNNLIHAYHIVSADKMKSTTFRFSRTEGYHNQVVSNVSEKDLSERCDEFWNLKIILLRINYLARNRIIKAHGSFGISRRKLYARKIYGKSEMFPDWEEGWL